MVSCFLGEADPKVQEMSGMKNYNMKIGLNFAKEDAQKAPDMIDLGILYENGNKSVLKGKFLDFIFIFFHYVLILGLSNF